LKAKSDFIVIFSINALLFILFVLGDLSTSGIFGFFRVVLGGMYVLFAPGYALQAALFPRREHLGSLDRLALSFGLSVAIMPVLGLALDGPPGGIFLWQSFTFLTALTIICGLVAMYRRSRLSTDEDNVNDTELNLGEWWKSQSVPGQLLFSLIPVSVIIGLVLVLYILFVPIPEKQFTEFYIRSASDVAANYPLEVKAGQPFTIKVGVVNHEGKDSTYSIQSEMHEHILAATAPFTLVDGQSVSLDVALSSSTPGDRQLMEILLLRDNRVYRRLYLWLNVESP
jgi:uncharacterized membrane protein